MVVPPNAGQVSTAAAGRGDSLINGSGAPPRSRIGGRIGSACSNNPSIPLSARRAERLDMSTVERKTAWAASREPLKRIRPHGLQEAPVFRPTEEEFRDPMEYMRKIYKEGSKYGICKVIPPDSWNPDFAIDTERFHFRTRRQELNSVEGATRANLNYLDQLAKFHKQHGTNLNRFPSVDKRPLDLYELKKAVESRGGFDRVCKGKKWAEIGRDLGYSGKIMSSLSTSLKNSYQKWLHPYEEYLRIAKPGVHQQLEFENGGPFTPSPGPSPMRKSFQSTPSNLARESPTIRASNVLQASIDLNEPQRSNPLLPESSGPVYTSGFTAVNSGGFTAVNAAPAQHPSPAQPGLGSVNSANGLRKENTYKFTNGDSAQAERAVFMPRPTEPNDKHHMNGNGVIPTKRPLAEAADGVSHGDSDHSGRRSKRIKHEAPTVTGSHMMQPRFSTPRSLQPRDRGNEKPGEVCEACGKADDPDAILLCDSCDNGYHRYCLEPPLKSTPDYDWHCPKCLVGTGEYGFEEGGIYSLKQFQEKARYFKDKYFAPRMQYDPVLNTKRPVTEDDVEREFWRLVQNITETVEVEYGADIHSTTHGSGFPTIERKPRNHYSTDPWNLNILPLTPDSLFRHIKSDISGMTVPWLYVGMCFSTFCWHNEDHYTYSANYQHFGATKTWYGIPGEDAAKFEDAMRQAVPELFETQPDLLFQLVTLLPPDQLRKAGVRVYALDQRAGQFVITFPQAYHAGFNHGFNFNEAVNFAPSDWEPFGQTGVERLRDFRRQPCFSHDELLLTAAAGRDVSIKTAKWLAPALQRLLDRETANREAFEERVEQGNVIRPRGDDPLFKAIFSRETEREDLPDEEYSCSYCKAYSYMSRFTLPGTSKVACLDHIAFVDWGVVEDGYVLHNRMTNAKLQGTVQKVWDKARMPEEWQEKYEKAIEDDPKPQLKILRSLVADGDRMPWDLPDLLELKKFVDRCNAWVEEATNYITRKQQNRRKNDKLWRKNGKGKDDPDDRDRDSRKLENIQKLLDEADKIGFDCPEIATLQERADAITAFRTDAETALAHIDTQSTQEMSDLVELGRSFFVEIPEVERLDQILKGMKWTDKVKGRNIPGTLQEVKDLIKEGGDAGMPDTHEMLIMLKDQLERGEIWEAKAKELMEREPLHFAQLDSLTKQALEVAVTPETKATMDGLLRRQREAQEQMLSLYKRSRLPDIRQRPLYKEVREMIESVTELTCRPGGVLDIEKEQKRHEDWMRRGKKLFGKSNAPLHILLAHMQVVEARNDACFDLRDKPRTPVEPSSREHTPENGQSGQSSSSRDVFCICRTPEAGMMIECHICREWYHGKCLKIARGKVKDEDDYTCPICDWRVKIPRDAARPKLEELTAWQSEIPSLPFQPDEEACLTNIVGHAQAFRDYMQGFVSNGMVSTFAEVPDQRFYLRKIEGADILLGMETNFFRQELHRLVPVAPEAPPIIEVSGSTRKPRPTKQQKLMKEMGVETVDELPVYLRKISSKKPKSSDGGHGSPVNTAHSQHTPLQPAFASAPIWKTQPHIESVGPASALPPHHPAITSTTEMPKSSASPGPHFPSTSATLPHDPDLEEPPMFAAASSLSAHRDAYGEQVPSFDENSVLDPNLFGTPPAGEHEHAEQGSAGGPTGEHGAGEGEADKFFDDMFVGMSDDEDAAVPTSPPKPAASAEVKNEEDTVKDEPDGPDEDGEKKENADDE